MRTLVIAALLVLTARAHAFPTGSQFDLDALAGDGAGGIAFDGAPRFQGHTCAVCHTDAEGRINARIEADHAELFTDGWKAGQQYHLRVLLLDAHAAALYQAKGDDCGAAAATYTPCDQNGFALEIADFAGKPVGTFSAVTAGACASGMPPPDVDVRVLDDGSAVTHNGAHHGQVAWDLCWTAPAAGVGLLSAYLSVVDGNGGNGTAAFPADTIGDDVTSGAVPVPELGAPAFEKSAGCATSDPGLGLVLVVLALLIVARRRKGLAALIALATAAGCVHVRPRQRETLARKNMKFAPDPTEDELDLHMQEAREGSSGGYGSSGGGCGCN